MSQLLKLAHLEKLVVLAFLNISMSKFPASPKILSTRQEERLNDKMLKPEEAGLRELVYDQKLSTQKRFNLSAKNYSFLLMRSLEEKNLLSQDLILLNHEAEFVAEEEKELLLQKVFKQVGRNQFDNDLFLTVNGFIEKIGEQALNREQFIDLMQIFADRMAPLSRELIEAENKSSEIRAALLAKKSGQPSARTSPESKATQLNITGQEIKNVAQKY